jgi:hypothetical protein
MKMKMVVPLYILVMEDVVFLSTIQGSGVQAVVLVRVMGLP